MIFFLKNYVFCFFVQTRELNLNSHYYQNIIKLIIHDSWKNYLFSPFYDQSIRLSSFFQYEFMCRQINIIVILQRMSEERASQNLKQLSDNFNPDEEESQRLGDPYGSSLKQSLNTTRVLQPKYERQDNYRCFLRTLYIILLIILIAYFGNETYFQIKQKMVLNQELLDKMGTLEKLMNQQIAAKIIESQARKISISNEKRLVSEQTEYQQTKKQIVQKQPTYFTIQNNPLNNSPPNRNRTQAQAGKTAGIDRRQLQQAVRWKTMVDLKDDEESYMLKEEINYYENKYSIGNYSELPFCIVVPTFNNGNGNRWYKNIKSIIQQNYTNFHVSVIDDASEDATGGKILDFLLQSKFPQERFKVIRNSQRKGAMSNLRYAAKSLCDPHQIFLVIDGDDELIGRQVLKLMNANFQKYSLWFAYSNFLTESGLPGYSRQFPRHIIEANQYRQYPFVTSHLRAFYTQLFLNVMEGDLQDEKGEYLQAANDVAICIPILQQAHHRVLYIPQVTYFYNSDTGLNNHHIRQQQQSSNERKIRSYKRYNSLSQLFPVK